MSREVTLYQHLKQALHLQGVTHVACHCSGGEINYIVIQMKKTAPCEPRQALNAHIGYGTGPG